jgi:large subunit ribosomal protein L19
MSDIVFEFAKKQMKKKSPNLRVGDTVLVHQKVKEGDQIRTQIFEGVVISFAKPNSLQATLRVRKIAAGVGVEKTFLIHSPWVEKIEVKRSGHARRAKLYYLRGLVGKAASKLKEKKRELSTFEEELVEEAAEEESVPADEHLNAQESSNAPETAEASATEKSREATSTASIEEKDEKEEKEAPKE